MQSYLYDDLNYHSLADDRDSDRYDEDYESNDDIVNEHCCRNMHHGTIFIYPSYDENEDMM